MQDVAFEEPVVVEIYSHPIRTVEEATQIVRARLHVQFTMNRLTTLLALERAAEGLEVAEAREVFCCWARNEVGL